MDVFMIGPRQFACIGKNEMRACKADLWDTGSAGALECGGLPPLYWREASFARKGGSKLPHSKGFALF
jgi:hypothetical protein